MKKILAFVLMLAMMLAAAGALAASDKPDSVTGPEGGYTVDVYSDYTVLTITKTGEYTITGWGQKTAKAWGSISIDPSLTGEVTLNLKDVYLFADDMNVFDAIIWSSDGVKSGKVKLTLNADSCTLGGYGGLTVSGGSNCDAEVIVTGSGLRIPANLTGLYAGGKSVKLDVQSDNAQISGNEQAVRAYVYSGSADVVLSGDNMKLGGNYSIDIGGGTGLAKIRITGDSFSSDGSIGAHTGGDIWLSIEGDNASIKDDLLGMGITGGGKVSLDISGEGSNVQGNVSMTGGDVDIDIPGKNTTIEGNAWGIITYCERETNVSITGAGTQIHSGSYGIDLSGQGKSTLVLGPDITITGRHKAISFWDDGDKVLADGATYPNLTADVSDSTDGSNPTQLGLHTKLEDFGYRKIRNKLYLHTYIGQPDGEPPVDPPKNDPPQGDPGDLPKTGDTSSIALYAALLALALGASVMLRRREA